MIPMKVHVLKSILLHGKDSFFVLIDFIFGQILGHRIPRQLNVKCYVHQAKML
jgi:hypothetical protein